MCLPGTDIRITRGCFSPASCDVRHRAGVLLFPAHQRARQVAPIVAAVAQYPNAQRRSAFGEGRGARVVGADHQRAAGRQPLDEVVEHRAVRLGAAEEVEMVGLDVGHHRDVRGVFEQ